MPKHLTLRVYLPVAQAWLLVFIVLVAGAVAADVLPTPALLPTSSATKRNSRDLIVHGRFGMSMTELPDLKFLRAGGISGNFTETTASVDIYDVISNQSNPAGNLTMARYDHSALRLSDGRVLIVGGDGPDKKPTTQIEIYDLRTRESRRAGSLVIPRCAPSLTQLLDGDVLVAGGSPCPPSKVEMPLGSIERLNIKTGYAKIVGEFRVARYHQDATLLKDGRVLFTSGIDPEQNPVTENEIYDPAKDKVAAAGAMNVQRCMESIVHLPDGTVLFAGGVPCGRFPGSAFKSAEIFDPQTNHFKLTGEMNAARYCPGTVVLKDGKVLLAGGAWSTQYMVSMYTAELYDIKLHTFSPTGNLTTRRTCPKTKLRIDGTVLIQGGLSQGNPSGGVGVLRDREIYDPVRGRFTALSEVTSTGESTTPSPAPH